MGLAGWVGSGSVWVGGSGRVGGSARVGGSSRVGGGSGRVGGGGGLVGWVGVWQGRWGRLHSKVWTDAHLNASGS